MTGFLEELLFMLSHSTRTAAALVLAMVVPVVILILGDAMTTAPALIGNDPLQPLRQGVLNAIDLWYLIAAAVTFFSFLGLALRCYQRDRRRFLHL